MFHRLLGNEKAKLVGLDQTMRRGELYEIDEFRAVVFNCWGAWAQNFGGKNS
jgi:hypothetical protein